ncbi:inosine-5-monophosphate dehydrogenase [Camelimonas fluminis]|uniref:CBS domain-containing protein n=1 Tax=Camelimonas fluminis TaxID=1576911 RepID=A0ABV7UBZ3_9HYPH|nr:CBS domain-containing protein [Camelimonas fluminis]GHE48879.1 inosine-5-monophosphate dehydrogenase [Camelimonas fluminis]
MTVARILADKGRNVTSIEPEASLRDAADLMAGQGIGAVLVLDAARALVGILSERDVVRAISRRGPDVLRDDVRFHMTRDVTSCTTTAAVNELMALMTASKFRHVPVVENGRVLGVISIGDVVKFRLAEIESEHQALREYIATA